MKCASCGSQGQGEYPAEICIHFPGLANIDKPHVLVFPQLLICPRCGDAKFTLPEDKLRLLVNGHFV